MFEPVRSGGAAHWAGNRSLDRTSPETVLGRRPAVRSTSANASRTISDGQKRNDAPRPVPVARRKFGAWGYALHVRVAWGERRTRERGLASFGGELRRASDFSVSPRSRPPSRCPICRDGSHRRAWIQPCGHLFCRPCAKRLVGRACLRCGAICRQAG